MKNIKIFAMAALAAFALSSCSEGTKIETGKTQLKIKISSLKAAPQTRFLDDAGITGELELNDGYIFVVDATGNVVHSEAIVLSEVNGVGQTLKENSTPKEFASDSRVYILGNVPSDVTVGNLATWADIQAEVSNVTNNTDYTDAALANSDGALASINIVADGEAEVTVSLTPLYSRMELAKVIGGEQITGFSIVGVYVDEYYKEFTMTGAYSGTKKEQGKDLDFDQVVTEGLGSLGPWNAVEVAGSYEAVADDDKVWAFHMAAGSVPRFTIELNNITYEVEDPNNEGSFVPGTVDGSRYITVTGYSDAASKLPTGVFERGHIYKIGDIEFGLEHLGITPNIEAVTITVDVNVIDWVPVNLTPIL